MTSDPAALIIEPFEILSISRREPSRSTLLRQRIQYAMILALDVAMTISGPWSVHGPFMVRSRESTWAREADLAETSL
jgi:hypothetical protein